MPNQAPRRRVATLLGTIVAIALAFAAVAEDRPEELPYTTSGGIPQLSPDYHMTSHKVVLITDHAINPRLAELEPGQLIAWISYSPVPTVIVFEREVARSMICHSLVNFTIEDDEIRSAAIHAGEFASFCELKPGRYNYTVRRPDQQDRADASKRLRGTIIVGENEGD